MTHRDRVCPGRKTASTILLFVACALSQAGNAAGGNLLERIDKAMASHYPAHEPGAAVLAARSGEVVFRGAYGLASVELQVPVRAEMAFCLASVTKLFTAVAAMKLVEDGALRLDDEVTKYLPELVETRGVTIAHLLSHTSGMTGPFAAIPGYRQKNIQLEITPEELISSYASFPLLFPPGERFKYSNEGVATLARILELVSKQSWEDLLRQRIFEPAGMKSSYYGGHDRIIPLAVTGYSKDDAGWKRAQATSFSRGFGMGGLFSTVDDLFAWHKALLAGRLVKPETLKAMFTLFPLKNGGVSRHGFGFVVTELQGRKFVGHGGSHEGWSTFIGMLPDDGIMVAVLTNRSARERSAQDDVRAIIGLMLADSAENPLP